jgi:hypothetical protein
MKGWVQSIHTAALKARATAGAVAGIGKYLACITHGREA